MMSDTPGNASAGPVSAKLNSPLPSTSGNVHQGITQSGETSVAIGQGHDVQIGPRYYNTIDAEGLRLLLQAFGSHLPPAALAEGTIALDDKDDLPILNFEAALAKRINARLTTLEELHKAGQLAESQTNVFNQVKYKVRSMMQLQKDLERLEADADRLLQAAILDLTNKLKDLELSQTDTYLEIRSQACLQEQIDILKKFQADLEDGKVVAHWLDKARSEDLVVKLRQHVLKAHPQLESQAAQKTIEAFDFSIGLFLETLAHCLNWGRNNILSNPEVPRFLADEAYIAAFEVLKTEIPDTLPESGVRQLILYIDDLIHLLPTYEYKLLN